MELESFLKEIFKNCYSVSWQSQTSFLVHDCSFVCGMLALWPPGKLPTLLSVMFYNKNQKIGKVFLNGLFLLCSVILLL